MGLYVLPVQRPRGAEGGLYPQRVDLLPLGPEERGEVGAEAVVDGTPSQPTPDAPGNTQNHNLVLSIQGKN